MAVNCLENARDKINKIDRQMAELFEQRMDAVEEVIMYKKENNLPVFDQSREQFVVEKNKAYLKNPVYVDYYEKFIIHLMNLSKSYQKAFINQDCVGYQGAKGAFSHIAATRLFSEQRQLSYQSFEDIFKAVENGEIAYGVVPFENSYTGEVGEVLDLLFQYNCKISRVYDLKINQNLLGLPEAKLSDVKHVYSKDQALSQCKHFFEAYSFELIPYSNTALAAQYVAESKDITKAAVASAETAELYGLKILVPNINTSAENTTRFIVITKSLQEKGNRFNLMFTVNHNAGQLANVMQVISDYGFNMESIKSRSIRNLPWQYYFYVEIEGDAESGNAKAMISRLTEKCGSFKVVGVYQKETEN